MNLRVESLLYRRLLAQRNSAHTERSILQQLGEAGSRWFDVLSSVHGEIVGRCVGAARARFGRVADR